MGCLYDTMTTWLKWQNEVQGAFTIKVTSLGIAKLVDMQHPTLENYVVQGIRVVEDSDVIRTRSKVISLVVLARSLLLLLFSFFLQVYFH